MSVCGDKSTNRISSTGKIPRAKAYTYSHIYNVIFLPYLREGINFESWNNTDFLTIFDHKSFLTHVNQQRDGFVASL